MRLYDVMWRQLAQPTDAEPDGSRRAAPGAPARAPGGHRIAARPVLCNQHSALTLDVHAKLLRTSGGSFGYTSGRSQAADRRLPWFGVGREARELHSDRHTLLASLRPSLAERPRTPTRRVATPPR